MEQEAPDPFATNAWHRERLLEALEAYRTGVGEAPLLRKWSESGNQAATANPDSSIPASKAIQPGPMSFVLSTDEQDRHGDVIATGGWNLDSYRKNPVLLTQY